MSARNPYGIDASALVNPGKQGLPPFLETPIEDGWSIYGLGENKRRVKKYMPIDYPLPQKTNSFMKFKVFIAKAYGCGAIGEVPSTPVLSTPGEACTETFLEIGPFDSEVEAANMIKYIKTKFFRTLVGIQKQTQNTTKKSYRFVPIQDFTSNSDINWNDEISGLDSQLFKKYGFNEEEIEFIQKNIQEME